MSADPMSEQNDIDKRFMRRALELAGYARDAGEVPVGSVLVLNNEVIGEGFNQPIASHDPTAHAELMAIRQAAQTMQNYRLPESTIYVTLEPCTMCIGAMIHARVSRLVYGAREPRAGAVESALNLAGLDCYNHRFETCGGVLADESANLLREFFASRRK